MNSALRIGVIGCGLRAAVYCDGVDRVPAVQLRAYADVNQASADRFLARYGGGYATNDPERVLADPDIDAVFICTWHDTHTALAVSAAAHGKHILIEKPMALTIGECWTIEEAVRRSGVTLTVGLKMRFMPIVRRAKQIAGQPLMMVAQMMNDRIPDGAWSLQPGVGGGSVLGAGCHLADLLCYLAGSDPVEVHGMGGAITHPNPEIVDCAIATVKFANGAIASLIQGDPGRNPYASTFFCEVFGKDKGVCLRDRFHQATVWGADVTRLGPEDLTAEERADIEGDVALLRHFADSALRGKPGECRAREGRIATTVMAKIVESIRTGLPQKVEADWRGTYA
jgi:myo-inositol 2-dehydrogenase/D-chiro-inositol 1-dehydrogenase